MIALTYNEWKAIGWQVQYGQRSNGNKNAKGEAVFNLDQCYETGATKHIVEEAIKVVRTPVVPKPPRKTLAERRADGSYTPKHDIKQAVKDSYTHVPESMNEGPF